MSKWNLDGYFKNVDEWQDSFKKLDEAIPSLAKYKGKLHKLNSLVEYLQESKKLEMILMPLYGYAHQSSDLDQRDNVAAGRMQMLSGLFAKWNSNTSFFEPEIIEIGLKKIEKFLKKSDFLKEYEFNLRTIFFNQKHVLNEQGETILSSFSPVMDAVDDIFNSVYNTDRQNEEVTLSDGKKVVISMANYRSLLQDLKLQEDRALVFEAAFKRFVDNKNAFAAIYNSILQNLQSNYKNRNFTSALEAKLNSRNIPISVYTNLLEVAHENTDLIKRYIELRKKVFGIKEYHTYDRFLELSFSDNKYPYDKAREMFFDAIKDMPKEFVEKQKEALADGYVDVAPSDGKRSGAYSTHFYGYHPYILLNHNDTLDAVFTVAHEAGHSAHSIFSAESQPYPTHDYEIFVAEIASTFNEHILLDYLLERSTSKEEKISLLGKAIDDILGTFYRQTLFAHYEFEANKLVSEGKPVNSDSLSQIMIDLYKHYYDIDISKEKGKQYVWAYIPHLFHTPFYVYQYATSFSASLKFYENVKENIPGAFDQYMSLLRSGGSDFPVTLVMKAGINLTTKDPFLAVVHRFKELLDKLEDLIK